MVPVQCKEAKIHQVLDAQRGYCEGNALARQRVSKSRPENWNNHSPECFDLLITLLHHLAISLVESSIARIWRHHIPELVEIADPGMLFEEGRYPVHQMFRYTKIDGMKNIGYDNSRWRYAFHISDDAVWGSNCMNFQILSCFLSLRLIFLSCVYHLVEVWLVVSQLPWWWIPISKQSCRCFTQRAMVLLNWMEVNVFEVVSRPYTDDRITLLHPTIRTKQKLSSVKKHVVRTKNELEDLP